MGERQGLTGHGDQSSAPVANSGTVQTATGARWGLTYIFKGLGLCPPCHSPGMLGAASEEFWGRRSGLLGSGWFCSDVRLQPWPCSQVCCCEGLELIFRGCA